MNLAQVYFLLGRLRHAYLLVHDAVEECARLDDGRFEAVARELASIVERTIDRPERALDHLDRALEWARRSERDDHVARLQLQTLVPLARVRSADAAWRALDDLERSHPPPTPGERARRDLAEAELADAVGESARARRALERSRGRLDVLVEARDRIDTQVRWIALAATAQLEIDSQSLDSCLRQVIGCRLRPMELRLRLAAAQDAERRHPGQGASVLASAEPVVDWLLREVPPQFRLGWAARNGYLRALDCWQRWVERSPEVGDVREVLRRRDALGEGDAS